MRTSATPGHAYPPLHVLLPIASNALTAELWRWKQEDWPRRFSACTSFQVAARPCGVESKADTLANQRHAPANQFLIAAFQFEHLGTWFRLARATNCSSRYSFGQSILDRACRPDRAHWVCPSTRHTAWARLVALSRASANGPWWRDFLVYRRGRPTDEKRKKMLERARSIQTHATCQVPGPR